MLIPESLAVALRAEDMRIIRGFGALGIRLFREKKKKDAHTAKLLKEIEQMRIDAHEDICPVD